MEGGHGQDRALADGATGLQTEPWNKVGFKLESKRNLISGNCLLRQRRLIVGKL